MRNLAYSFFHLYPALAVRESSPRTVRTGPSLNDWSDDELKKIRCVLQKITALRVCNPDDAEDLVQETLLTMTEKCPEVEIRKGLLIWGMGILRYKIGNYYGQVRRYEEAGGEVRIRNCRSRADPSPTPEALLRYAELSRLIDAFLKTLSAGERNALVLFLRGYTTSEIVRALRPEHYQNVVNRLFRGRRKIARELERRGYPRGRTA